MTNNNLVNHIKGIITNKTSTLHLYLILRDNDDFILRLADIGDGILANDLKQVFIDNLNEMIGDNPEIEVRSLSADDEAAGAIYKYDYDEYPKELNLFKSFSISDGTKTEKFNFTTDNLNKLFGFIIYIGTMKEGLSLFKMHYSIALIKRETFLLGVIQSKERFEKISGTDIIRMNGDWQLIKINGEIFVRDRKVLERNLGFKEFIKTDAGSAIRSIKDFVSESTDFSSDIDNPAFARKLALIAKSSEVLAQKIPGSRLVQFTQETPGLSGRFEYDEKNEKFVLKTKTEKMAFLRLLNDDYLQSLLTKEYYSVNSKDKLKNNSEGEGTK